MDKNAKVWEKWLKEAEILKKDEWVIDGDKVEHLDLVLSGIGYHVAVINGIVGHVSRMKELDRG